MRDQVELVIHPDRRWYAVMTQPQREALAWQHLCDRDFEVFVPRIVERIGHPWRGTLRSGPMFPGYVFLHAGAMTEWHLVTEAPCVLGIVMAGDKPVPAREGKIELMQKLTLEGDGTLWVWTDPEDEDHEELRAGPIPTRREQRRNRASIYAPNQELRVLTGPWTGFIGRYIGGEGRRLKLWLDIFGDRCVSELTEAQVTPA